MDMQFRFIIIIVGIFLGITLGLYLLFVKPCKSKANYFLSIIAFGFTSILLLGYLYSFNLLEAYPQLIPLYIPFTWAYGILVYLYVRACTEKDFKMRPRVWLHLLPVFIGTLFHYDLFIQSGAEKAVFCKNLIEKAITGVPKYVTAFKALLAIIYYTRSVRLVFRYKKQLANTAIVIDRTFHRWLLLFANMSLFPILVISVFSLLGRKAVPNMGTFFTVFLYILVIYAAILLKPRLFREFPHQIEGPQEEPIVQKEQKQRYEKSTLQEEQKARFLDKLLRHIKTERPYQDPELTLTNLAEQVNIPPYYLSQVINEKLNCSFLDFINGYRVEEAKEKIIDHKYKHYTIVAIAYESGFNSKSAFYAAFKKHVGTTPSAFREEREWAYSNTLNDEAA